MRPWYFVDKAMGNMREFPWMHIASGVSEAYLRKEWMRMEKELTTIDCRDGCNVCGLEHAAQLCEIKLQDRIVVKRRAVAGEPVPVIS